MNLNAVLHEIKQLHSVSDRLQSLAEHHPKISDGLIRIADSVRNTATILEVLVATKIGPLPGSAPAND